MAFCRTVLSLWIYARFVSLAALCALSGLLGVAQSQTLPTPTSSESASLVDVPSFTSLEDYTVHDDALLLLASHIAEIGTPWTALRIQGNVTLPGASNAVPATLLLQNLNQAILTIDQPTGLQAVLIEGAFRKSVYSEGRSVVDAFPAGVAGLMPLSLLHNTLLSPQLLAMKLMGNTTVQGKACDKLSLRLLLTKALPTKNAKPHNVQVDYYLDKTTHLVLKSVVSVPIPGIATPQLQETYYSGYKGFGLTQFPQRITQTIGGSPLWDLTVTGVTPEIKIDNKEFTR